MAEFENAKRDYASARTEEEQAHHELLRASEKVKRLQREMERAARRAQSVRGAAPGASELAGELAKAQRDVATHKRTLAEARGKTVRANADFAVFTDPTKSLAKLPDDVPIALFPLRLETRFLLEAQQRILCVRVFPDDVLIDSFQAQIGQTELDNVVIYWTQRWRAGGDPAGHRAAWAQLVRAHGAGRARWLTEQVTPLNPQDEPDSDAGEHVLVIRPPAPVAVLEQPAIAAFWERVWSTTGTERDQAFADLVADVGAARATEIETQLVPTNLRDTAIKPDPTITPVVVFLDLPDPS